MKSNQMQNKRDKHDNTRYFTDFWVNLSNVERSITDLLTELSQYLRAELITLEFRNSTMPSAIHFFSKSSFSEKGILTGTTSRKYSYDFHESLLGSDLVLKLFFTETNGCCCSDAALQITSQLFLLRLLKENGDQPLFNCGEIDANVDLTLDATRKHVHDLRNHLGIIKGYTTTLLRKDTIWPQATQIGFLKTINSEADQINDQIANYYAYWKITNQQLNASKQLTNTNDFVAQFIQHNQSKYQKLEFFFETLPNPLIFHFDSELIRLLTQNLIDTIGKCDEILRIWFKIRDVESGLYLNIECTPAPAENSGKNDLPQIIAESFSNNNFCDPLLRYIANEILKQHNGTIRIELAEDGRSIFYIYLPSEDNNFRGTPDGRMP